MKMLFGRVPHSHKCFNAHDFYIAYVNPLCASPLKISSHFDKICRGQGVESAKKMVKSGLKLALLTVLYPGKPSKLSQIFWCKLHKNYTFKFV